MSKTALYNAQINNYKDAFKYIDKAINKKPQNFSMKNSSACISFYANQNQNTSVAINVMRESMETLEMCFNNDKRKDYHARHYANFAMILNKKFNIHDYLVQALEWMNILSRTRQDLKIKNALEAMISTNKN